MKAQEYLRQIEKLDTIIKNKLIEKDQWKAVALGVTARMDGERVQSSGSKSRMADALNRCVDVDREIDHLIDKMIAAKRDILETIEKLNTVEYDVLHMIYIQGRDFHDVACKRDKSYSWATSVHGRALKNVQRIIDGRDE